MSEPRFEDDFAAGINQPCETCDEMDCVCFEPDTMEEARFEV